MSCRGTCSMSGHVLFRYMNLSRICLTGRHVQHVDRFYRMECYASGHILLEDIW